MSRKITVKNVQEVTTYQNATSVDCWETRQSDYALRKGYGAIRKRDKTTGEVFYLIKVDCSSVNFDPE